MANDELEKYLTQQIERLNDLGLGLGAHLIQGWRGQLDRAKRFHERFIEAENSNDATASLDYALTFFLFMNGLREWLAKWEKIPNGEFNSSWEAFTRNHIEMRLVRDIANVTKHLTLRDRPSVDKQFALFWSYDPFVRKKSEWVIHFNEREMRLVEVMQTVVQGWDIFAEEIKLP